jgi:hypothetical protein
MPAAPRHTEEVVVAKSKLALFEAVVVKVAESAMPSRVTHDNAVRIKDPNASARTAPIPASVASVMAIDEFSTLPTLIVSPRPSAPSALCRGNYGQRDQ